MLKDKGYQNISNYFVKSEDVAKDMRYVISQIKEGVFGLEICIKNKGAGYTIITPPHLRIEEAEGTPTFPGNPKQKNLTFYKGYLSRPFFLPIYSRLNGDFIHQLELLPNRLTSEEGVFVQWLFRRRDDWKDKALKMFSSYLQGNDSPLYSTAARTLQDKAIQLLSKIIPIEGNEYIDEAEVKLLSEGYQFQLTIAIQSNSPNVICEEVKAALRRYDSYNAIRVVKVKKGIVAPYTISRSSDTQIMSEQEILSLFGGNMNPTMSVSHRIASVSVENNTEGNVIQILPKHDREAPMVREGIVNDIAEALKRVGIIKVARLYNSSVVAGVRLTVVQCDIPKGKNLSHITNKVSDIQAALGVVSLGVEQGNDPDTVKFVIPNEEPASISLRELIELKEFQDKSEATPLTFVVGVDEINNPIYLSLSELVHLMVAGTTGSGKSVFLNTLSVSLLATYRPDQLKMYMIDPKEVELQQYKDFPHVEEVITSMDEAEGLLKRLVKEMDARYKILREAGVKNVQLYNDSIGSIPYIVCIIDEYADLKDTNPDVEEHIARLGQKARAAGIHLVIATQRPSTNIISGRVKAVIPNAISFNLNNNTNYRTVFGTGIKYSLLGKGDGVMKIEGYPKEFQRFQSAIVAPDEALEEEVYKNLIAYYSGYKEVKQQERKSEPEIEKEDVGVSIDSELLYKLKEIIATTKETRVSPLRDIMKVKTTTMTDLMGRLVEEGWLKKHDSKAKGYELIAPDSVLEEWKTKD